MTFFHYMHKDTALHRMDGRIKLLCMLLFSLSASLASEWRHFLVPLALALAALGMAKLPVLALLKDMKFFAVLICIVLVTNAFTIAGDPIPYFPIEQVSMQGVAAGLRFAGRILLIFMVCTVMTGTTPLLTFQNVIEWYLRPIPFIPEVRIAMMIKLTFVWIPILFDSYTEMANAQKSRGVDLRRNPVKRVKWIVFPLLSRTLRRTDEIVYAMESRCYSEVRTRAVFKTYKTDWLILAVCVAVLLFVIV